MRRMSPWNRRPAPPGDADQPGIHGPVRLARSGADPTASMRPGDIAVVDIPDLDQRIAESLVQRRVAAVVNAAPSSTGRFPNLGPRVLAEAGIPVLDAVGSDVLARVRNGDVVRLHDDQVFKEDSVVAAGATLDPTVVSERLGEAGRGLSTRLATLTANAADHLDREHELLLDGARVPKLSTRLRGRPVVVVSPTYDVVADLRRIRPWIRDRGAVLVGAGAGADLLLGQGLRPAVVVGSMDELSDEALKSGAEVVVVASHRRSEGHERFERAGVDAVPFVATGSSADLAIVMADTHEAAVIVQAGAPPSLPDVLERDTQETASALIAQLRAGTRLVDAKAVGVLSARQRTWWAPMLLLLAGVVAVAVAVGVTPVGQEWFAPLSDLPWIEELP